MNLRHDSQLGSVKAGQRLDEVCGLALLDQIDGAAAKATAGQPRANQPRQTLGQRYHGVGLHTTGFEIPAIACVRLGHRAGECWPAGVIGQHRPGLEFG